MDNNKSLSKIQLRSLIKELFIKDSFFSKFSVMAMVSFIVYSLGYSFLYGFYFGRDLGVSPSIFEIVIAAVPFNFYSVITLGCLVALFYLFLILFFRFLAMPMEGRKNRTIFKSFISFLIVLFFQIGLSLFFIGNPQDKLNQVLQFSLIWVVVTSFILFIFWVLSPRKSGAISGFLYSIFLIIVINLLRTFFKIEVPISVQAFLLLFFTFLIGVVLGHFNNRNKFVNFVIYYPYATISLILLTKLALGFGINISVSISVLLGAVLTKIYLNRSNDFFYFVKKLMLKLKLLKVSEKDIVIFKEQYEKKVDILMIVPLFLIATTTAIIIIISYLSLSTGIIFRDLIPERSLQIIQTGAGDKFFGELVTYKDDVFYISDEKWQLVVLKNLNVKISSCE
jgi:MFS family permease